MGSEGTEIWDVQGETAMRSYYNLQELMKFKEMHLILLLYTDAVENILKLQKMIMACKVPYLVVRTKIDMISEKEAVANGFGSREDYMFDAYNKDVEMLRSQDCNAVLAFTSSETKERFDEFLGAVKHMHSGIDWAP